MTNYRRAPPNWQWAALQVVGLAEMSPLVQAHFRCPRRQGRLLTRRARKCFGKSIFGWLSFHEYT